MARKSNNDLLSLSAGRESAIQDGALYAATSETVSAAPGAKSVLHLTVGAEVATALRIDLECRAEQVRYQIIRGGTPSGTAYTPNEFNLNDVYMAKNGYSDPAKSAAISQTSDVTGGDVLLNVVLNGTDLGASADYYIDKFIEGPLILVPGLVYSFSIENTGTTAGDIEYVLTYIDRD